MPDSPETIVDELQTIARMNTLDLDASPEATIEWRAAQMLEQTARTLREIAEGARDPRAAAAVALLAINGLGSDEA